MTKRLNWKWVQGPKWRDLYFNACNRNMALMKKLEERNNELHKALWRISELEKNP